MKRNLENCRLIKQKEFKPVQHDKKCEGFGISEEDDETCDVCKKCKLYIHEKEVENE